MSHSHQERLALAEALELAGPGAPTLCAGWTALDLAAHVVARERRPDSLPGIMLPGPFHDWSERVRREYARRPFGELVGGIAAGPGRLTWAGIPGVDAVANLTEFFVHAEDARRGRPGWEPRTLPADRQAALWTALARTGRLMFRRAGVGVTVEDPAGRRADLTGGDGRVVLRGEPGELLLVASGRGGHAVVEFDGPADAVTRLRGARLGM